MLISVPQKHFISITIYSSGFILYMISLLHILFARWLVLSVGLVSRPEERHQGSNSFERSLYVCICIICMLSTVHLRVETCSNISSMALHCDLRLLLARQRQ